MFISTNIMTNEQTQYSSYQEMMNAFKKSSFINEKICKVTSNTGFKAYYKWILHNKIPLIEIQYAKNCVFDT